MDGILGRWRDYARNGYGGNVQLRRLRVQDCQGTVLEVIDPGVGDAAVVAVENRWKAKLRTRVFGLNDN